MCGVTHCAPPPPRRTRFLDAQPQGHRRKTASRVFVRKTFAGERDVTSFGPGPVFDKAIQCFRGRSCPTGTTAPSLLPLPITLMKNPHPGEVCSSRRFLQFRQAQSRSIGQFQNRPGPHKVCVVFRYFSGSSSFFIFQNP